MSPEASPVAFTEYDLDNGLHVILAPMNGVPLVATNLWYHVGSKDENPNRTGFAHLFEHMMFQGSRNVGKTEHFKYVQHAGGLLNATTSVDRTNYFETLPSSQLGLAMWLESDRMLSLDVTEENFQNQRDVVKEEYRQRYANRPYGLVWQELMRAAFPTSGYNWITIGSMAHLDDSTINDVRAFHKEYYKPNNCSLAICGSFDESEARKLIDTYFAAIPRGKPVARPQQVISPISGEVRIEMEDSCSLPAVYVAWRGPALYDRDEYAFDLFCRALDTGRSSRLYQELVYRRQIAREPEAFNYSLEKSGAIVLSAKVQPQGTIAEVEAILREETARFQRELLSEEELQKVKNRCEMALVSVLGEMGRRVDMLQRAYIFKRDTAQVNRELEIYRSITAEEIRAVAQKYLSQDSMVVLHVLPR